MATIDPHRSARTAGRRRFLTWMAAATAGMGASIAPAAAPRMPAGLSAPAKPTAMPAFELPTVAGQTLRSASLKGQALVIRFWASW